MPNPAKIVAHTHPSGNADSEDRLGSRGSSSLATEIRLHVEDLLRDLDGPDDDRREFHDVEVGVVEKVFRVGQLLLEFFLTSRQENSAQTVDRYRKQGFRKRETKDRTLKTFFGEVKFTRAYVRRRRVGCGVFPLDIELGLAANSFSLLVVGLTTRLSTLVPFDQATAIVSEFLGWSPAKQSIEDAVLEVGKYTGKWFEQAGPPSGDGDVLVVQFDGKCVPTATDTELSKRRGKRRENRYSDSARHRGREERHRRGKRKRRKKGDKSKNGKEVTVVVMYTLKWESDAKGEPFLKGPINKWVYASFGSKRHVFEVAQREAIKRGFGPDSDKLLQVVTDGDNSLADLIVDYFPGAMHTIDIMHALEYLWKAGSCLHKEGSKEQQAWFEKNKRLLYDGEVTQLVKNLEHALEGLPRRGPGTKSRRDRLSKTINYLKKRVELMDYRLYQDLDLEIASGAVEGAVRHVVAKRFDYGSMRWIRERGEPLLQLRCIQINGDWEMFLRYVRRNVAEQAKRDLKTPSLRCSQPQPLPTIAKAS